MWYRFHQDWLSVHLSADTLFMHESSLHNIVFWLRQCGNSAYLKSIWHRNINGHGWMGLARMEKEEEEKKVKGMEMDRQWCVVRWLAIDVSHFRKLMKTVFEQHDWHVSLDLFMFKVEMREMLMELNRLKRWLFLRRSLERNSVLFFLFLA